MAKRDWTPEERRAAAKRLAAGREAAAKERDRRRIIRVKAYETWLARGSVPADIPEIPSDDDYEYARKRGIGLRRAQR